MSNPLFLEVSEAPHINLVVRVSHVGYNTAILQLVHVFSTNYMLRTLREEAEMAVSIADLV